ncbi:hypothetical protein GH714_040806 [Hevea brasiliensis]|uniref:Glucose/Sorbosone dehydrogenase domain-containing protein n=1 Tax=Hevea brasiliensis TaxID=3981 RepID=A0A6A6MQF7_HEVBR|nr:hypothetical protein GH714_040806 [Hevea brasiliensis]
MTSALKYGMHVKTYLYQIHLLPLHYKAKLDYCQFQYHQIDDLWQSKTDFCKAFGGASTDGSVCFDGEPVTLNKTGSPSPPAGLCLEKIGNGSYLNMVAHPDGSNRAFFSSQPDEVYFSSEFGMMGMAFHPNFAQNGRFFASFNCDKVRWPGCVGRCSCNSDVNCDPSKLASDNGAHHANQSVIAEYTANGTAVEASLATTAKPLEVRRILTMGLPFTSHHGGQILFGPKDGYLYFMMGDGGGPDNAGILTIFRKTRNHCLERSCDWMLITCQQTSELRGLVAWLIIATFAGAKEINNLGLWGNYSIPKDNPFSEDSELLPEIWALGLRNPWRCSFDSERPSYFMCADVGQDLYEEVDIITKGGNYGWRVYEGPYLYNPPSSPGGNTSPNSISPIFPVMGYNHSEVNKNEGSASITGGYFCRSKTDPCMYGRYLYADLYAGAVWAGTETPEDSGNFTTSKIPFSCAKDSPIQCISVPGSNFPSLGYIFSFGEDKRKDIFVLTSSGVYRVVRPSRCSYTCSKENVTNVASPGPTTSPPSNAGQSQCRYSRIVVLLSSFLPLLFSVI